MSDEQGDVQSHWTAKKQTALSVSSLHGETSAQATAAIEWCWFDDSNPRGTSLLRISAEWENHACSFSAIDSAVLCGIVSENQGWSGGKDDVGLL